MPYSRCVCLLRQYDILKDDAEGGDSSTQFGEEDIDSILSRRTEKVVYGAQHSSFSKATFTTADGGEELDVDDPEFWSKVGTGTTWEAEAEAEAEGRGMRRRGLQGLAAEHVPRYAEEDDSDSSDSSDFEDDESGGGSSSRSRKGKKAGSKSLKAADVRKWKKSERDEFRKALFALGPNRSADTLAVAGLTGQRSLAEAAAFERLLLAAYEQAGGEAATAAAATSPTPASLGVLVAELEARTAVLAPDAAGSYLPALVKAVLASPTDAAAAATAAETTVTLQWSQRGDGALVGAEATVGLSVLRHDDAKFAVLHDQVHLSYLAKPAIRARLDESAQTARRLEALETAGMLEPNRLAGLLDKVPNSKRSPPQWLPEDWPADHGRLLLVGARRHGAFRFDPLWAAAADGTAGLARPMEAAKPPAAAKPAAAATKPPTETPPESAAAAEQQPSAAAGSMAAAMDVEPATVPSPADGADTKASVPAPVAAAGALKSVSDAK